MLLHCHDYKAGIFYTKSYYENFGLFLNYRPICVTMYFDIEPAHDIKARDIRCNLHTIGNHCAKINGLY